MRISLNVEFTDEEALRFVADAGRRVVLDGIQQVVRSASALNLDPGAVNSFFDAIKPIPTEQLPDNCVDLQDPSDPRWSCCHCLNTNAKWRESCARCGHLQCYPTPVAS